VDIKIGSSAQGSSYGIICRYKDHNNFYALRADDEGYFSILKIIDGKNNDLIDWDFSDDVPKYPTDTIHLKVSCNEDQFSISINGKLLGEVTDDEPISEGQVGLEVGLNDKAKTDKADVSFSNFKVYEP
jgi:hypothetical protein